MTSGLPSFYHLHLVSDSTGETLTTIAKAASVQYALVRPIEHVHPLVRTPRQLKRVLQEIESGVLPHKRLGLTLLRGMMAAQDQEEVTR